ncbi:MAG: hypothetical protein HFF39_02640 [Lawsonibacter sp.]|nr:hypothetical protein [Lawsonibacter sp.]
MKRGAGGKKLPLLAAAALLLAVWIRYDRQFTPRRWAETDDSKRGKLVNSLLEQYGGLEGMTRVEVEALLGPDMEGEQWESEPLPDGSWSHTPVLLYRAGGRPLAFLPEFLCVRLEDGVVAEAELMQE